VKQYRFEKPEGYFYSGQATDACINKPGWKEERRPFTSLVCLQNLTWSLLLKAGEITAM
jgi:hypothetical protein